MSQLEFDFGVEYAGTETPKEAKVTCPKCASKIDALKAQLSEARAEIEALKYRTASST